MMSPGTRLRRLKKTDGPTFQKSTCPAMTTFPASPSVALWRYQPTTHGPDGFCITPLTISIVSTSASIPAASTVICAGADGLAADGRGDSWPIGPGRSPPAEGMAPTVVDWIGSCSGVDSGVDSWATSTRAERAAVAPPRAIPTIPRRVARVERTWSGRTCVMSGLLLRVGGAWAPLGRRNAACFLYLRTYGHAVWCRVRSRFEGYRRMTSSILPDVDTARALLREIGIIAGPEQVVPMPGGTINTTFRIAQGKESPLYLRIAPDDDEVEAGPGWLSAHGLRREAAAIGMLDAISELLPRTVHADWSRELINRDWVLQTE